MKKFFGAKIFNLFFERDVWADDDDDDGDNEPAVRYRRVHQLDEEI